MCESWEVAQRVEICELRHIVRGEDQGGQVRDRVGKGGLYIVDAVARKEERV